jgi:hypothetical protein
MPANHRVSRPLALLAIAGCLVTAAATDTGHAQAAGRPDLAISQLVSANSQAGHTSDIVTVANHGSATASHLNVELLFTTSSGRFSDSFAGDVTCETMPAPSPYRYALACQLAASLGTDQSVSFSADLAGAVRAKFSSLALVGELQPDAQPANNASSLTTYFGTGADLAVAGAVTTGAKVGHANAVIKIVNQGPSAASLTQAVLEAKHVGTAMVTNHKDGCRSIPPASGYDYAASCVVAVLATGKAWTGDVKFIGVSGRNITVSVTASSHTADPDPTNNTLSWRGQLR